MPIHKCPVCGKYFNCNLKTCRSKYLSYCVNCSRYPSEKLLENAVYVTELEAVLGIL